MSSQTPRRLLSIDEAADQLGVTRGNLETAAKRARLHCEDGTGQAH